MLGFVPLPNLRKSFIQRNMISRGETQHIDLMVFRSITNTARMMETQSYLSFEEIKRNFDTAFSYIVIEDRRRTGDDHPFLKVERALSDLNSQILNRQMYRDQNTGRRMLIVKMEHQDTEEIILEFLKTSLKKDFNCYVY